MAHVFTDPETGRKFTLSPITVKCDPIPESFTELLEEFGAKCQEILHPAEGMLRELESENASS